MFICSSRLVSSSVAAGDNDNRNIIRALENLTSFGSIHRHVWPSVWLPGLNERSGKQTFYLSE